MRNITHIKIDKVCIGFINKIDIDTNTMKQESLFILFIYK